MLKIKLQISSKKLNLNIQSFETWRFGFAFYLEFGTLNSEFKRLSFSVSLRFSSTF